jgi:chromate reductase, NAD(P)H dehydrogenase (quinone)
MHDDRSPAVRLLTVCGSLQRRSTNRAALDVASAVAAARGATIDDFDRLAELPAFDPSREGEGIAVVEDWQARAHASDAVLVAAPEYAGALAGAVKNAFDWLVGAGSVYRKPVAVISAGTTGGLNARRMMIQTLTWQGAYVVAELGIASPRAKSDDDGRLVDPATLAALTALTEMLLEAPAMNGDRVETLARDVLGSLQLDADRVAPAV